MTDPLRACRRCGVTRQQNPSRPSTSLCFDCRYAEVRETNRSWQDRAACIGDADDEKWFPPLRFDGRSYTPEQLELIAEAKAMCSWCPVALSCYEAAMAEEDGAGLTNRFGIRDGRLPEERHAAARRRRAS